jgi:hypothetical protein
MGVGDTRFDLRISLGCLLQEQVVFFLGYVFLDILSSALSYFLEVNI